MRKNAKKVDIIIIAVIVLLIAGVVLQVLMSADERKNDTPDTNGDGNVTANDYTGRRLGIITGTNTALSKK